LKEKKRVRVGVVYMKKHQQYKTGKASIYIKYIMPQTNTSLPFVHRNAYIYIYICTSQDCRNHNGSSAAMVFSEDDSEEIAFDFGHI